MIVVPIVSRVPLTINRVEVPYPPPSSVKVEPFSNLACPLTVTVCELDIVSRPVGLTISVAFGLIPSVPNLVTDVTNAVPVAKVALLRVPPAIVNEPASCEMVVALRVPPARTKASLIVRLLTATVPAL